VRGSIPTPLSTEQFHEKLTQALMGAAGVNLADPVEVQAYIARLAPTARGVVGGNTTCVEIDTGSETIIIDCGSGMRPLGYSLMAREFGRGQGVAHVFLTHAHWDHLLGFPFFLPAYVPGNKLIFYAVNHNPQYFLEHQQTAPTYFPIPPNAMPAEKEFVQLREGETISIGRLTISNLSLYHPGTAHAYRFDDGESVFVFASDGEYKSLSEAALRKYITFFSDADVLVFDSQYSLRDVFLSKADWGHSSAIIGVDIAERARVKKLVTFHHDPTHSDEQIYAIAASAREYAAVNQLHSQLEVLVGVEGLEFFLGQPPGLEVVEELGEPVSTLALAGHLSAATAPEAQSHLQAMMAAAPAGRLLLDTTLLSTADAIGIKALLDVTRQHPTASVALLAPSLHIRRALDQSGAGEILPIFLSRQQAMNALAGPAHLRLAAETIGGRYQISVLLFVDELGVVYEGLDKTTRKPVLARVVAGNKTEPARAEFLAKLQAWQTIQHPGLLPSLAVIENENWLAMISDGQAGMALFDWLALRPAWADLWRTGEQLCGALGALHAHNIVHGDLRPENIVVYQNQAQIARAPLFPHGANQSPSAYQAPEQFRGQPPTRRTDVYSLGIVLYEMFLGAHPFAAETEELRLTLQLYSQPQSPRHRWPEIPAELEQFLLKLLASEPEERFDSGPAILEAYAALPATTGPQVEPAN
jgi:phosphoribosyl 1,2-cyclic phosphodiesterase/anti-anti-sigma regulatory factor